jgi:hypothetical protein
MKRKVALAILGVAAVATFSAQAQGVFQLSNYANTAPYAAKFTYDASVPGVGGGDANAPTQIQVWWGEGNVGAESLVFGANANWSSLAGYTDPNQNFLIPAGVGQGLWAPGETWTLQLRAAGTAGGKAVDSLASGTALLVVNNIADSTAVPPPIAPKYLIDGVPIFVPEPTTFALAGLGAAALLIFRRRD